MKVFFDMEFTGLHQGTTPISIGCIAEDGRKFYGEMTDYDESQLDDWIDDYVIDNLQYEMGLKMYCPHQNAADKEAVIVTACGESGYIALQLGMWLESFGEKIEMWSDCLAYDWVLFCELFGGAFEIPDCVYYIPFDLATALKLAGYDPDVSREQFAGVQLDDDKKHFAIWDAEIIKKCYERLYREWGIEREV